MELYLIIAALVLLLVNLIFQLLSPPGKILTGLSARLDQTDKNSERVENTVREEVKTNRQELSGTLSSFQSSFLETQNITSKSQLDQLKAISDSNREELTRVLKEFQTSFDRNVESFNTLQREKFGQLEIKQQELIQNTEKKLEQMRETVDEKLQKTLNERLGQSFELVSRQLESVQKGLGEMQNLAQDVGGLKKVLSNVKMRGGLGEVRLEMLLEQILAPEQYEANVKTKKGSSDRVEFAIKLPGRDEERGVVYLPVDAKFPQEAYHHLTEAYENGDADAIEASSRNLEAIIKKMARDIQEKYIDPPNTTDFGIMFLPFEGVFAEVIRRSELIEQLQRDFRIMVTGPTTLAAILNSLQMGFKTLAIQQRSSEVWKVLGAIKTEFGKFGGMLEKAQKNLHTATNQLDELVGKRTKAIQRRLKDVESLPQGEAAQYLPEMTDSEDDIEEDQPEES
ncbi:MAG: DNA recombination protein RmuC [Bacteroidales bacterium]|nr:DNA recombination protein RmuC [Bacteroidales bacterium]